MYLLRFYNGESLYETIGRIFAYVCLLLDEKICYTNFHEPFLQDGTPQVL